VSNLKVAALMCSYNGLSRGYLKEALLSVMNQTRKVDEFVFVDDGSTDGTVEFVKTFVPNAKIIRTLNGGLPKARNAGIAAAESDVIAFLDDDDLWAKDRIERTLDPYEKDPKLLESTIVFSGSKVFYGVSPSEGFLQNSMDCYAHWPACLVGSIIDGNGGVMLPLNIYKKVGFFREDLRTGEDLDYWHRALLKKINFRQIQEPLFFYRKSHSSMTSGSSYELKRINFVKTQLQYDPGLDPRPIMFCLAFGAVIRQISKFQLRGQKLFWSEIFLNFSFACILIVVFRMLSLLVGFNRVMKNYFRSIEAEIVSHLAVKPKHRGGC
jgi:glycosyltransferase involved in cell wall biosynthesis